MLTRMIRHHHQIVAVHLEVVGPTINDWRAAQARKRRDDLCIPAWEPYAPLIRPRTDVAQTWRDRGTRA